MRPWSLHRPTGPVARECDHGGDVDDAPPAMTIIERATYLVSTIGDRTLIRTSSSISESHIVVSSPFVPMPALLTRPCNASKFFASPAPERVCPRCLPGRTARNGRRHLAGRRLPARSPVPGSESPRSRSHCLHARRACANGQPNAPARSGHDDVTHEPHQFSTAETSRASTKRIVAGTL